VFFYGAQCIDLMPLGNQQHKDGVGPCSFKKCRNHCSISIYYAM